jgi:hypothetical protein
MGRGRFPALGSQKPENSIINDSIAQKLMRQEEGCMERRQARMGKKREATATIEIGFRPGHVEKIARLAPASHRPASRRNAS